MLMETTQSTKYQQLLAKVNPTLHPSKANSHSCKTLRIPLALVELCSDTGPSSSLPATKSFAIGCCTQERMAGSHWLNPTTHHTSSQDRTTPEGRRRTRKRTLTNIVAVHKTHARLIYKDQTSAEIWQHTGDIWFLDFKSSKFLFWMSKCLYLKI